MVVVHPARRLGKVAASAVAHIVVEHDDARRAERIAQQTLHLGVVDRLDFVEVIEVADGGRRLDQREAVAIQGELRLAASRVFDPHMVRIEDARGREAEFTLDRNGFTLVKAATAVRNFYDLDEIKSVYYPEVERLLRDTLGASRVVVFDHNVRNGRSEEHTS